MVCAVNRFAIGDTHFGHARILEFTDDNGKPVRPFKSVEEMDETIIERWNNTVGPNDKVYHLGDVYFGHPDRAARILRRLNGRLRLILGNHDNIDHRSILPDYFERIMLWFPHKGLLFSHAPVPKDQFRGEPPVLNVHGHTHHLKQREPYYHCISAEQVDYTPVHFDQLFAIRTRLL